MWTAIVECMGRIAMNRWNIVVEGRLAFAAVNHVQIDIISSVNAPRLQIKGIIWTLIRAFYFYNEQGLYTSANLKVRVGEGANVRYLGFIRFKTIEPAVTDSQMNSSTPPWWNDTSLGIASPLSGSLLPETTSPTILSNGQIATNLHADGLDIGLNYVVGGASFNPASIYESTISALLFAAQHDDKLAPCGYTADYNTRDNYTLAISPTSAASRDRLLWRYAIEIFARLPGVMLAQGRGGKWAELNGRVRLNGQWIGRIRLAKGDFRNELRAFDGDGTAVASDPCDLLEDDTASS